MTLNPFTDGNALLGVGLNGMVNAHAQDGIITGVTPSKGAGSYDVDIASGTALIDNDLITVAADTVTLTSAAADADLDAGEFRVDVITVDTTGTINVAEGTAAVTPIAPSIPTDEALIAFVIVDGSGSSISSGDIHDRRVIVEQQSEFVMQEDDNSPVTHSGSASVTYTLADTYDHVIAWVVDYEASTLGDYLELQVNGETADYDYLDRSGTSIASADIPVTSAANLASANIRLDMAGAWTDRWGVGINTGVDDSGTAQSGINTAATSPMTQFSLTDAGGAFSATIVVYGVNF